MASSSSVFKPQKLRLTGKATYFHCLRMYHQDHKWNSLQENNSNVTNCGWKLGDILIPVMTDELPVPEELLNAACCNYQVISKNRCGGNRCSRLLCRRNGLKCVLACGNLVT